MVKSEDTLFGGKSKILATHHTPDVEAYRWWYMRGQGLSSHAGGAGIKVSEDPAVYAQQPDEEEGQRRPRVQITVVGIILEALYLAVPRPARP